MKSLEAEAALSALLDGEPEASSRAWDWIQGLDDADLTDVQLTAEWLASMCKVRRAEVQFHDQQR